MSAFNLNFRAVEDRQAHEKERFNQKVNYAGRFLPFARITASIHLRPAPRSAVFSQRPPLVSSLPLSLSLSRSLARTEVGFKSDGFSLRALPFFVRLRYTPLSTWLHRRCLNSGHISPTRRPRKTREKRPRADYYSISSWIGAACSSCRRSRRRAFSVASKLFERLFQGTKSAETENAWGSLEQKSTLNRGVHALFVLENISFQILHFLEHPTFASKLRKKSIHSQMHWYYCEVIATRIFKY